MPGMRGSTNKPSILIKFIYRTRRFESMLALYISFRPLSRAIGLFGQGYGFLYEILTIGLFSFQACKPMKEGNGILEKSVSQSVITTLYQRSTHMVHIYTLGLR